MNRFQKHTRNRRRKRRRSTSSSSMLLVPLVMTVLWTLLVCLAIPAVGAQQAAPPPPRDNSPIIGIDLGTAYSCVGVFQNGKVEILPNDQGNRIIPSYVAFSEHGERLVGDAAKNQATINPENTIFDVKRLIGRQFSDDSVQADRKLLPFQIIGKGNKPMIQVTHDPTTGARTTLTPEEVSAMVLSNLKATAELYLGQPIQRAVITVPAYFNNAQKQATEDAGKIAGLQVERIINEPTAAALTYGLDNKALDDATVLVFDLGGGTHDVTLLGIDDGFFEVKSTAGDTHLGGEDFDQRVMQYYIKKIQKQDHIDISHNKVALQKLRKEVERVKRALSTQTQARLDIDDLVPGLTFSETLTRARFEELNNDLFKKTLGPIQRVLKNAKLEAKDIDHIVLVGGSTRIPKIQQLVTEYFGGKELSRGIHPDEAVAHGAAIMGAILSGANKEELQEIVLIDVASLSLGIETVGGVMSRIVDRDTHIPVTKSQVFSTQHDNQNAVTIQVYEGERPMTKDNHLLGRFELTGIPPAPRGTPQIEVSFALDTNGLVHVSAVDKGTGKSENITITSDQGSLSKEEIDRMVAEAKKYEEEDRLLKERIDAKNGLESYLYNLRNTLEDGTLENISARDSKDLLDTVDETLDWLNENPGSDTEDYQSKLREVEQIANPIMRQAYSGGGGTSYENDDDFGDDEL